VRLEVASLPAGVTFAITLLTTNDEEGPGTGLAQMLDAVPDALCWLIEGHFQFELRGEFVTTEILVPLDYAPEVRRLSSQPCERDDGSRRVIQNTFYSGFSLKGIGFVHG
jgi:hypothetical protein